VAWHFELANEAALALPWFAAAIRAALVGGEPTRALDLANQALKATSAAEQTATISVLRAEAAMGPS
jgi:hypothetical protein